MSVVISGTGLFTPPESISNDELVACFNNYVDKFNQENEQAIEQGEITALSHSSSAFIEKASGIKSRYVMSKDDILNVDLMRPSFAERPNEALSMQAEIGVAAAKQASVKKEILPDAMTLL